MQSYISMTLLMMVFLNILAILNNGENVKHEFVTPCDNINFVPNVWSVVNAKADTSSSVSLMIQLGLAQPILYPDKVPGILCFTTDIILHSPLVSISLCILSNLYSIVFDLNLGILGFGFSSKDQSMNAFRSSFSSTNIARSFAAKNKSAIIL